MTDRPTHPHELISAMLDGEIDERERAVVEAHLRQCPECRDLAGDLTALGEAFADEPVPPVPAGLDARIGWRLRSQGASRQRLGGMRWSPPRTLAALGGVAAAVILTVLVVREGSAPFLERSPARQEQKTASEANTPSAATDEAQEKLRSLGGVKPDDTSGGAGAGTRNALGSARADASRRQAGSAAGVGAAAGAPSGSGTGGRERDVFTYAPAPAETVPSETPGGSPPARTTPVLAPSPDKKAHAGPVTPKLEAGAASGALAPAVESPALQERAKKAAPMNAPAAPEGEGKAMGGFMDLDSGGGGSGSNKDAGAGGAAPAGKEVIAGATEAREAVAPPPPQAAPAPPPSPDRQAARGEPRAPSLSKSRVIDNESLVKQAIPLCPDAEGAKPVKRWTATSAPLPLRMALSEAEPDLAALAARLGGSICVERPTGAAPRLVIDVPVTRWAELRDAMSARAAATSPLSAPPAEGYDLVRIVARPR